MKSIESKKLLIEFNLLLCMTRIKNELCALRYGMRNIALKEAFVTKLTA